MVQRCGGVPIVSVRFTRDAADRVKDGMHVVPVDDLIEHDTSDGGDCVCGPTREETVGGWLVVHSSLDGRELSEVSL